MILVNFRIHSNLNTTRLKCFRQVKNGKNFISLRTDKPKKNTHTKTSFLAKGLVLGVTTIGKSGLAVNDSKEK